MKSWDPERIATLMYRAGAIALDLYDDPSPSLKSDRSVVTHADTQIEALFSDALDAPEEGSFLIGEETVHTKDDRYIGEAFRRVAWIVDPIDGTAPYANRLPQWGVSLGRMEAGRLTDGAIYLPVTREFFISSGDNVLYSEAFDGTLDSVAPAPLSRATDDESAMIAITQEMAKRTGLAAVNPVQALGCAVIPLTYLTLGRYLGYVGTVKLWDIAGALPLLFRAGYRVQLADGTSVSEQVDESIYRLGSGDPRRWKLRDRLVCAADGAIAHRIAALIDQTTGGKA